MKLIALFLVFFGLNLFAERVIELETKKGSDGKTHWLPEKIEVTQGEKVKFVAKYTKPDDPKAFDFHGLFIPELKITQEVHTGKTLEIVKEIPKDLEAKEYKVGCHLHPAHVPAILVVKKAAAK